MQPSSGTGIRDQGKQGRSQGKGQSQQSHPGHGSGGTGQRPNGSDSSRPPQSNQASDPAINGVSKVTNPGSQALPKPPSGHGGIAAIFNNTPSHVSNGNPPVPSGGDWTAVKPRSTNPNSSHPAAPVAPATIQPTSSAAAAASGGEAPLIPVVSLMFDHERSSILKSAQSKLEDLCHKRSELDVELKSLIESLSETAGKQKEMRDKLSTVEKELEGEKSKRETLEVEVKALTKQRKDEMANRE